MHVYLNLGYHPEPGGAIGGELLQKIREVGFHGIRQDVPDHLELTRPVAQELASSGLHVIFLFAGGHMTRPGGLPWEGRALARHVRETCEVFAAAGFATPPALEIGNEPDLAHRHFRAHPERLVDAFRACYEAAREVLEGAPVLTPSVSNLNRRGLEYLERMLAHGVPDGAEIAVHRYPNGQSPSDPHDPFATRGEEIQSLLSLVGERRVWVTEAGRSEGPGFLRRFFFRKTQFWFTEDEVADYMEAELRIWARVPQVKALVWYQLNSGADRGNELHNYGIRRVDGSFKPIARRFSSVIQEVA